MARQRLVDPSPLRIVVIGHNLIDPRYKVLYIGVHARQMLPAAANAPRYEPNQCLAAIHG